MREFQPVEGSCLCGRVRFEVTPPSRFCSHCHCQNCRRAHGAAFVTYAGFVEQAVRVTAGEEILKHYRTDTEATRSFCTDCGSTLFYRGPRWPGEIHVVLANLHGEIDRRPESHAYVDDRASWWTIQDDLPQHGGKTGVEPKTT